MFLDSHVHLGDFGDVQMTPEKLISAMKEYGIDIAIVSSVGGMEYDSGHKRLETIGNDSQFEANKELLEIMKENKGKLFGKFWFKPHHEMLTDEVKDFIVANRAYFKGLKMHPYHSKLKISDDKCLPYIKFAEKEGLPIAVHTATDQWSDPLHLIETAKRHPKVTFIMVHLCLGSDNQEAIKLMKQCDNVFGDTTWVPYENVKAYLENTPAHKLLFGSDSPIDGVKTYEFYKRYLDKPEELTDEAYKLLMSENAKKVFNII